ncbi:MAG: hypothetical protein ABSF63_11235 [Candidatus Bathyarchaeia archaeon]
MALCALAGILFLIGFFGIAVRQALASAKYRWTNVVTNGIGSKYPRFIAISGFVYRTLIVILIAVLVVSRNFWVAHLASIMKP